MEKDIYSRPIPVSVVVPVYNEAGAVAALHREIVDACEKGINGIPFDYEIIFVNDGSTDGTDRICRTLTPLKYVCFRKNFGQTAAMDCGFHLAEKDFIIAMDGDGQNDPADIPALLRHLIDGNLDVVSGWRKDRKDTFGKKFVSRGANVLRQLLIRDGIHDSGCSLKAYRRECFENVHLYGEQHRFIPALLKIKGFTVGEIPVHHRPRTTGKTKYNFRRTFKGFLDMLSVRFWSRYACRPLHLLGGFGLAFLGLALLCGIWSAAACLAGAAATAFYPLLLTALFAVTGLLLFVCGLMSEFLVKLCYGSGTDTPYSVKEIIDNR